jgi:hypothetical protein
MKIYYSGDSNSIKSSVLERLKNGDIDRLYQDTCKLDYEGNAHLSLRRLTDIVEPGLEIRFIACIWTGNLIFPRLKA